MMVTMMINASRVFIWSWEWCLALDLYGVSLALHSQQKEGATLSHFTEEAGL